MKKLWLIGLLAALMVACSQPAPGEVREVEVTRIVEVEVGGVAQEVEVTREVIVEVPVEVIVEVTSAPSAVPQNFVFLEYQGSGSGSVVTDNFSWPACQKAVFIGEKSARDNFVVDVVEVATGKDRGVINMLDDDFSENLFPLDGGTYYLDVRLAPEGEWKITGVCRD